MSDEYRTEVIRTAAAQHDAAEREMDAYRDEITRINEDRDRLARQLVDAGNDNDQLTAGNARLRDAITALLGDITASADATRPSKKTALEDEFAIALRKLLETP